MKKLLRYSLLVCGIISVTLAVIGIFLPLVPTTPFLLLAAFLFDRSSPRFHGWLLSNRWFGEYIRNYREGRGISARQKANTIAILWPTILVGMWFAPVIWSRVAMLAIAVGVTSYLLFRLPTLKVEKQGSSTERVTSKSADAA